MPDKRLRGSNAYSTHKSTVANRRRLANMDPVKRAALRDRIVEYQAIWQLISRVSRKQDYLRATKAAQRSMLVSSARALLERRRMEGKAMCNTNASAMIDRHLKKEAHARALSRDGTNDRVLRSMNLKGVAIDPTRGHDTPPATPHDESDEALLELGLKHDPAEWIDNIEDGGDDDGQGSVTLGGSNYDSPYSDNGSFESGSSDAHINNNGSLADRVFQLETQVDSLTRLFQMSFGLGNMANPAFSGGAPFNPASGLNMSAGAGAGVGAAPGNPMGLFNFAPNMGDNNGGGEGEDESEASDGGIPPAAPGWPYAPPGVVPMFGYGPPREHSSTGSSERAGVGLLP